MSIRETSASTALAAPAPPSAAPRANIPSFAVVPLASPTAARVALAAAGVAVLALLFGLVRFVAADGIATIRLPRRDLPSVEEHNLAHFRLGPTVRVSSYHRDPINQHHPMFLVDGRTAPTLLEKWVSAGRDRQPWIEITWREPRQLARVVIRHAGEYEGKELTLPHYTLTCLQARGPGPTLVVADNHASLAVHPLACAGARGVRLDTRPSGKDIVRIYEIEAWGR